MEVEKDALAAHSAAGHSCTFPTAYTALQSRSANPYLCIALWDASLEAALVQKTRDMCKALVQNPNLCDMHVA